MFLAFLLTKDFSDQKKKLMILNYMVRGKDDEMFRLKMTQAPKSQTCSKSYSINSHEKIGTVQRA